MKLLAQKTAIKACKEYDWHPTYGASIPNVNGLFEGLTFENHWEELGWQETVYGFEDDSYIHIKVSYHPGDDPFLEGNENCLDTCFGYIGGWFEIGKSISDICLPLYCARACVVPYPLKVEFNRNLGVYNSILKEYGGLPSKEKAPHLAGYKFWFFVKWGGEVRRVYYPSKASGLIRLLIVDQNDSKSFFEWWDGSPGLTSKLMVNFQNQRAKS